MAQDGTLIALKLLLVPALLALVTLAGRRWGQRVAGWLGSFPIVAGPILLILTLENGVAFGVAAAAYDEARRYYDAAIAEASGE